MEKLEKIQRRALRLCIGLRQSTPSNVILAESGIDPLKHRFTYLGSKYILKSFSTDDNLVIDKLFDLQINLINGDRFDISKNFVLYGAFLRLKRYKSKIATFDRLPLYCHEYETISFS